MDERHGEPKARRAGDSRSSTRQLACFVAGTWHAPLTDKSISDQISAEIRNVVKWRPFQEVMMQYRQKKNPAGPPY